MRFVILHYHFFKNAGSTIEDVLDHSFGDRFGQLETPENQGLISNRELLQHLDTKPGLSAFSSHQIRHPLPEAPGYLFFDICFLRDPLDRLRSFYDYFRQRPNPADPMSDLANTSTLGEFVTRMIEDYSLFVRNNQVNLIACGGDSDEPGESDLELAIHRMREASFPGVVDCFVQSIAVGERSMRIAFPELDCARPAVNVSRGMQGTVESRVEEMRAACGPQVFEKLRRMTALDQRLVDFTRVEILRRYEVMNQTGLVRAHPAVAATHKSTKAGIFARRKLRRVFDPEFYLARNPDVRQAGVNPLLHYERHGAAEGRKPHPLFDPVYYRANCVTKPESGENPLMHFLDCGAAAASPHPLFNCDAYLRAHPDVFPKNLNPLVHYLESRQQQVRTDEPLEINDVLMDLSNPEPQQKPFLQTVPPGQIKAQSKSR
jgi:hypothetical protein